jgi:hypothetical protein
MLDEVLRLRGKLALLITVPTKLSALTYNHAMSGHDCRAMLDYDWGYNQPVDGDEIVSLCLVDYDLVDCQLAYAAGRLPSCRVPSKQHKWMVSNLLAPYSSTLTMQAQNNSSGCGKLIILVS